MPPPRMHATATVVFEYVWHVNDIPQPTSTYTTTYTDSPSLHTIWPMTINSEMMFPSQTQVVGIPYSLPPGGGVYIQTGVAMKAMHSPAPDSIDFMSATTKIAQGPIAAPNEGLVASLDNRSAYTAALKITSLGLLGMVVATIFHRRRRNARSRALAPNREPSRDNEKGPQAS